MVHGRVLELSDVISDRFPLTLARIALLPWHPILKSSRSWLIPGTLPLDLPHPEDRAHMSTFRSVAELY